MLSTLVLVAVAISVLVWYFLRDSEEQEFENAFVAQGTKLVSGFRGDSFQKMQALEFAIQNVAINSFYFYHPDEVTGELTYENSESLVLGILLSFRCGNGHYLPEHAYIKSCDYENDDKEDCRTAFRDAIAHQIQALTGKLPRVVVLEDGRPAVYYS